MFRLICLNNVIKRYIYTRSKIRTLHTCKPSKFHTEFSEAAKRLKIVFDTYGNIAIKSLHEQTSATYNILQDLESGKYAPDVAKVGLGEWVAELKRLNTAFAELMRERVAEGSMKVDIVLRNARTQLDEAYYPIVERVNA
ncbi:MAG: DUF6261 family protein, partial [Candidatus Fibromonas sp.]|nr:DUF6261 family protein [Candidatus Fibromonas sp.]